MATKRQQEAPTKRRDRADAKWAAVVEDRLVPMPQRHVKASVILFQANAKPGMKLVRDYDSPNDIGFEPDVVVDLADGNVFRLVESCECRREMPCDAPPKLAFVVDDRFELTIRPQQTGESLRGLLSISADAELLRDYESPDDVPVADDEKIEFADGPVFITRAGTTTITVKVNNKPVKFEKRNVTGLEIKQTAIAQDVKIAIDFVLYRVGQDGGLGASINDSDQVKLSECDEFRCVAPDDNS